MNISKFGQIFLWMIMTWKTSQNWKTKHLHCHGAILEKIIHLNKWDYFFQFFFNHGQLFVALSQLKSCQWLQIVTCNAHHEMEKTYACNIVCTKKFLSKLIQIVVIMNHIIWFWYNVKQSNVNRSIKMKLQFHNHN